VTHRRTLFLRRLMFVPLAAFVVVTFSFGLINLTPGDPAVLIGGDFASEERLTQIRTELGLDRPIHERYGSYIADLVIHQDLGTSFFTKLPVWDEIAQRLPDTVELIVMGLAVALAYGSLLGVASAYSRFRWLDRLSRLSVTVTQSTPDFLLGIVLIYVVFYLLGWAPAPLGRLGMLEQAPSQVTGFLLVDTVIAGDWRLFCSALHHSMLPVLTLGLFYSSHFAKTMRAVLVRSLESDQVEFARACGLPEWRVIGYAFRDVRTPVITYVGVLFAALFGGAAIVETIFAWGGLGQWAIEVILKLDIPAIQGFILVVGLLTLIVYFLLDIIVLMLDPRVKYE
jgi:ABC-type dipeptide/oligopeptide/nickel transport system permease component